MFTSAGSVPVVQPDSFFQIHTLEQERKTESEKKSAR